MTLVLKLFFSLVMDYYGNINQQVHLYFFYPVQREKGDVNMKDEYISETLISLTKEPHNKTRMNYFSSSASYFKGRWLCEWIFLNCHQT